MNTSRDTRGWLDDAMRVLARDWRPIFERTQWQEDPPSFSIFDVKNRPGRIEGGIFRHVVDPPATVVTSTVSRSNGWAL